MQIFGLPGAGAVGKTLGSAWILWQGRRIVVWVRGHPKEAIVIGVVGLYLFKRFAVWFKETDKAAMFFSLTTSGIRAQGGIPTEAFDRIKKIDKELPKIEKKILRMSSERLTDRDSPQAGPSVIELNVQTPDDAKAHLDRQIARANKLKGQAKSLQIESAVSPRRAASMRFIADISTRGVKLGVTKGDFEELYTKIVEAEQLIRELKAKLGMNKQGG